MNKTIETENYNYDKVISKIDSQVHAKTLEAKKENDEDSCSKEKLLDRIPNA